MMFPKGEKAPRKTVGIREYSPSEEPYIQGTSLTCGKGLLVFDRCLCLCSHSTHNRGWGGEAEKRALTHFSEGQSKLWAKNSPAPRPSASSPTGLKSWSPSLEDPKLSEISLGQIYSFGTAGKWGLDSSWDSLTSPLRFENRKWQMKSEFLVLALKALMAPDFTSWLPWLALLLLVYFFRATTAFFFSLSLLNFFCRVSSSLLSPGVVTNMVPPKRW